MAARCSMFPPTATNAFPVRRCACVLRPTASTH
jgi:hypothetical protein